MDHARPARPAHFGAPAKNHAARDREQIDIGRYESDYNSYLFPLRATLRAAGRLADQCTGLNTQSDG